MTVCKFFYFPKFYCVLRSFFILFTLGCTFGFTFSCSLPVYAGNISKEEAASNERVIRIAVLGDSLSSGWGLKQGESWVELLSLHLGAGYEVINASISGDTTVNALRRIPAVLEQKPCLVIVEIGGNDGLRGFPPVMIKTNLENIITQFQENNIIVVLAGIRILTNYGKKYTSAFYDNYPSLAEQYNLTFIPFFMQGVGGETDMMQDDRIHPNAQAQPILLQNVLAVLSPLLQDSEKLCPNSLHSSD